MSYVVHGSHGIGLTGEPSVATRLSATVKWTQMGVASVHQLGPWQSRRGKA